MIKSMTGYGRGLHSSEKVGIISIELKSVNQRFRDISIRLPGALSPLERQIKKKIEATIERGKIDVYVKVDVTTTEEGLFEANIPLAKNYMATLNKLKKELDISDVPTLMNIAAMPDIINIKKLETDDISWEELSIPVKEALKTFDEMRSCEGEALSTDMHNRLSKINTISDNINIRQPDITKIYFEKLKKRITSLTEGLELDESRLAQEAAIIADKSDITEEIVRLKSHINQFRELLESASGAVGRKLDFLLQEMNREANTIGSKCNDAKTTADVVDMKGEIERIKEQVQNIE